MERWVEVARGDGPLSRHALHPLRDLLAQRHETLKLDAGLADWRPVTIHFDGEIVPRDRSEPFKGAMFAAYAGDVVFSKIDARNGAIGLLPDSLPKAVVTAEYPVFVPRAQLVDAGFLRLVLRHEAFLAQLRNKATGTSGRKRVTPEEFLDIEIPLPTLAEQRRLAADFKAAMTAAQSLEREADALERLAVADFEAALGLAPPPAPLEKPVFIARFRDIERWSHEGMLRASLELPSPASGGGAGGEGKWPMVRLGDIAKVSYGLQKSPANRPGQHARPYLRVANVQRGRLDLREIKTINVPDADMPMYRLEMGDVLLCEGNSADLVGRGCIWGNEIPDCIHQNHVLRVRIRMGEATPVFLLDIINSGHGQAYFRAHAKRTTNLSSINSREVSNLPLPLPPLETQKHLTAALQAARAAAQDKRRQAADLRESARIAFEGRLFHREPPQAAVGT